MQKIRLGYVYFIAAGSGSAIKIGYSNEWPEKRRLLLQTGNHEALSLYGCVRGDRSVERGLHAKLAAFRLQGEWFKQCDEVMAAIDNVIAKLGKQAPPPGWKPRFVMPPHDHEAERVDRDRFFEQIKEAVRVHGSLANWNKHRDAMREACESDTST